MPAEDPQYSQPEVDELTTRRILSDAELIKAGAVITQGILSPETDQAMEQIAEAAPAASLEVPTNVESIPEPISPEQARAELLEACVREARGTVSAYSNLTLNREQKAELKQGVEATGRKTLANMDDRGGFQDFGEVQYKHHAVPMTEWELGSPREAEQVYFQFAQEGETHERITYMLKNTHYNGAQNRPGNSLKVSFELPEELDSKLFWATQSDPQLIRDLVEAQLASLGIPESVLRLIKPPYKALEAYARQEGQPPHLDVITANEGNIIEKYELAFQ